MFQKKVFYISGSDSFSQSCGLGQNEKDRHKNYEKKNPEDLFIIYGRNVHYSLLAQKGPGFNHVLTNPFFNTGLYSLIEKVKKRQG
tara:strand:- start:158 stop:415 length:258 start_codon:yes stop_codon:yes gene_type:complete